ncbi:MAG: mannosyltransferase family protein [Acidimicrobiales bacterium]
MTAARSAAVATRAPAAGADGLDDEPEATPRPWVPVAIFLGVAVAVWVVVAVSAAALPRHPLNYPIAVPGGGGRVFEGWARWDAFWYRSIAEDGYVYYPGVQSSVAFFPGYPLLVRFVALAVGNVFVAGSITTFVCGLLAARGLWAWLTARMSVRAAGVTVALVLLYPFSWYLFGAVYADALFLAAAIGAFVAVDRDRMWTAGLLGFVASASRPTGVAVAIGLVLVALEKRNVGRQVVATAVGATVAAAEPAAALSGSSSTTSDAPGGAGDGGAPAHRSMAGPAVPADRAAGRTRRRPRPLHALWLRFDPRGFRRQDAPLVLAFGGLLAYMTYLGVRFGHPLLFSEIQGVKGWDQPAGWSTWLKLPAWQKLHEDPFSDAGLMIVVQCTLTVVALVLVPKVAKRFGWGYAAFVLAAVAIPLLGSKDFVGLGRYLLPAFPCLAVVGEALARRRPWLIAAVLAASGAGLLAMASYFARGYYLS